MKASQPYKYITAVKTASTMLSLTLRTERASVSVNG